MSGDQGHNLPALHDPVVLLASRFTLTSAGLAAVGAAPNPSCPACATVMVPIVATTRD